MGNSINVKKMLESGLDALKKNKNEKALSIFEQIIKEDPKNTMAWNNKGVALRKLGKLKESIDCYNKVLSMEPNQIQAMLNKAYALKLLNKFDLALFIFEDILELVPDHKIALKESDLLKIIISERPKIPFDSKPEAKETKLFNERRQELDDFLKESTSSITDNVDRIIDVYNNGIKEEALELRDNILSAIIQFNEQLQDRIKRITAEFSEIDFVEKNRDIIDKWSDFRDEKLTQLKKLT
ncbi:MAG: tetratricopeptide repeat protein [Asgard group archaeon]|nr:tetratricopeptide repeat protein [Asgard group archaeon]